MIIEHVKYYTDNYRETSSLPLEDAIVKQIRFSRLRKLPFKNKIIKIFYFTTIERQKYKIAKRPHDSLGMRLRCSAPEMEDLEQFVYKQFELGNYSIRNIKIMDIHNLKLIQYPETRNLKNPKNDKDYNK